VQGAADVDGDGKAELFVIGTEGAFVPGFGEIQLLRFEERQPAIIWSQTNSAWVCADLPRLGSTWSTTASQAIREVMLVHSLSDERPAFPIAQRKAITEAPLPTTLTAMRAGQNRSIEKIWNLSGLTGDLQGIALASTAGGPSASIRLRIPKHTA